MTWSYRDPGGKKQTAFQVLVASSLELLNENVGDVWDSGVVYSEESKVRYVGSVLASERTYFWKVRVRNSEGVWSEEW